MIVLAAVILSVTIVATAAWWHRRSDRVVSLRRKAEVIVTLKDSSTFRGVLFDSDPSSLVLRNAKALPTTAESRVIPVDGEVLLLRPDVAMIQKP